MGLMVVGGQFSKEGPTSNFLLLVVSILQIDTFSTYSMAKNRSHACARKEREVRERDARAQSEANKSVGELFVAPKNARWTTSIYGYRAKGDITQRVVASREAKKGQPRRLNSTPGGLTCLLEVARLGQP